MPAYNAERTLERTLNDIPGGVADEIILVDDASRDGTVALAERLGLTVIRHDENRGYGGNQKTCYRAALERGADVVVMLHPDFQYDGRLIPHFVGFVRSGICDVMLGARIRTRREALDGGMPRYKYLMNRVLTLLMNVVLGQNLAECHSGFRVYRRRVLETIAFEENSDDFAFDAEFLAQAAFHGFSLGDAPMPVRYFSEASSIGLRDSTVYGLKILRVLAAYVAQRSKLARLRLFQAAER
jgi:glycosyltransferase involved in cell wall biosynthesis